MWYVPILLIKNPTESERRVRPTHHSFQRKKGARLDLFYKHQTIRTLEIGDRPRFIFFPPT
jgi:hypothetical protein